MVAVTIHYAWRREASRTRVGMVLFVMLENSQVVGQHHVRGKQASQHADGCLEHTHVHVVVKVLHGTINHNGEASTLKQAHCIDEQIVTVQHVKGVERVDERHVGNVALGKGCATAGQRIELSGGVGMI